MMSYRQSLREWSNVGANMGALLPAIVLALGRRASPCGGISALCAARHRWQNAQRTTNWWDFFSAPGAARHRWPRGSADHRQVELREPCAAFCKIFGVNPASTPPSRVSSSKETQIRKTAPRKDSQPPSSHDLPVDQLSEILSNYLFPPFTIFGRFLGWYCKRRHCAFATSGICV